MSVVLSVPAQFEVKSQQGINQGSRRSISISNTKHNNISTIYNWSILLLTLPLLLLLLNLQFFYNMADVEMKDSALPEESGAAPTTSDKGKAAETALEGKKKFEVKKVG